MKALTICQPYPHLILIGEKHVENRTWPTRYRGPLAIHAGKSRQWLEDGDEERPCQPAWQRHTIIQWSSCQPFVDNDRAVLIHRPRSAKTCTLLGKSHAAITYWCGNGIARKRGLPSAEQLAGRHVHVGKVKAHQTCCNRKEINQ